MHGETVPLDLLILAILTCIFVFALFTKAVSRTIITLPMTFVGIGLLMASPIERVAEPELLQNGTRMLAEVTLILVLFSDACKVRFAALRSIIAIPARMLVIGLPLTIVLGTVVALTLNPESGIAMALLTAAVLAPTDAALGQTVVTSPSVPDTLRQTINVESGLNDGLALPFVLLGATLVSAGMAPAETSGLATSAVLQVILGPLVGIAIGWTIARCMDIAHARELIEEAAGGIAFLTVPFIAYLGSEAIGGNGFIAAFVAGMTFGNTYRHSITFITEFLEGIAELLTMAAFLVFGALLLPAGLEHFTWRVALLAILFLTVVRMVPIYLSLLGSQTGSKDRLFLGWFGPRGLASVLFTLIIVDEFDFPGEAELLACVSLTVFLSILLHGVSATPLARLFGRNQP